MSRARRKQELQRLFTARVHIAQTMGMRLDFDDEDRPVVTMPYDPRFNQAAGGIHGGVYATLLDTAAWFAAALNHGDSGWIATSELTIHYLKPAAETDLTAVGRLIKGGRRQDIAESHLYDVRGELVGHAIGTFMLLSHLPAGPREEA
ncbi:MAG: PaaI family thioesterase [Deltaproteobacteria bacterium]|nr:PaaI family thioesterase [Deltaproteobacteria bacterium]